MSDSTYGAFEELTKDNYKTWRIHAEALLVVSDLWDYVEKDKELIPKDVDKRELWMKQDKIAKAQLMLHISSSLLPLVENCTTSREVWLKLANIYGNKDEEHEGSIEHSDTDDENEIIHNIEISVDDFFETINDLSEKKIIEDKKSLSTIFTDKLFSQLKINGIKKLPDKIIIVNTVSDFIDVISKLSKIEIKEQKNELSSELIDSLLVKFTINPHKNDNDETNSEADTPQTRDEHTAAGGKDENNQVSSERIAVHDTAKNQNEIIHKDDMTIRNKPIFNDYYSALSELEPRSHDDGIISGSYYQRELGDLMDPWVNLLTPPSTPTPKKTRKCGVCGREGHNRTTCPLNKPVTSTSKYIAATPGISEISSSRSTVTNDETPKRANKCGVCREEGHNRTTCPLNQPIATSPEIPEISSSSRETGRSPATPKTSYKCGICREEGHNRTTCPLNEPIATSPEIPEISSSSRETGRSPATPKTSYKCGICREEGHNRTTCPLNEPIARTPESPKISSYRSTETEIETPKRSYKCGGCGREGHNIRSCPYYEITNSVISSPEPAPIRTTPVRSYTCGLCGEEGHNRTTCARNYVPPTAPTRAVQRCGNCGNEGHNSRTCGRRQTSSSSYYTEPSYSYSSPASSYGYSSPASSSGGRRSYTCSNCGGSGHNRRTCSG